MSAGPDCSRTMFFTKCHGTPSLLTGMARAEFGVRSVEGS